MNKITSLITEKPKMTSEIASCFEPSCLFAKSILGKNKFCQYLHGLIIITFVLKGSLGLHAAINNSDPVKKSLAKVYTFEVIWARSYSLMVGISCAQLMITRSRYVTFIENLRKVIGQCEDIANQYIEQQTKIIRIIMIISFIFELIYGLTKVDVLIPNSFLSSDNNLIKYLLAFIATFINKAGWVCLVQFILETCLYLESAFIVLFRHLIKFKYDVLQSNLPEERKTISTLRAIRYLFVQIGETTRQIDRFFAITLASFYVFFVGYCLLIAWSFLYSKQSDRLSNVALFIGEMAYLIIMTYYLIRVNQLSNKLFAKIYLLSFDSKSLQFSNEINLFLLMVGRHDVGFTFAHLFVVTPNFISSLSTIALSLGLALPNLFE